MTKDMYNLLEKYMLSCMEDSAHDKDHIYRVLYNALRIAKTENGVNYDVLITACLLHDIGRKEQYENPELCHAMVGSEKAYSLLSDGTVSTGENDTTPSFFQEYKYKLEKLYSNFYTAEGNKLARERQHSAIDFYNSMYEEVTTSYKKGTDELEGLLRD